MDVALAQFTTRRMLLAVACFAVTAALLSAIAQPKDAPRPYGDFRGFFALAAIAATGLGISLLCGRRIRGTGRVKAICISIVCWELICLGIYAAYSQASSTLFDAMYFACIGHPLASFDTYSRLAEYVGFLQVTIPATALSSSLFIILLRDKWRWRSLLPTLVIWQVGVLAILIWSYEIGFTSMLNDIGWLIFGVPDNLYSFSNLMLHRIIFWVLCTAPIAWVALCLHPIDRNEPVKQTA
jgi:hypothetical protein